MVYNFYKGSNNNYFILLHGTGGTMYGLVPIARDIDPEAYIISLQGNVLEGDKRRFFKRETIGEYDIDSLELESDNLNRFLIDIKEKYNLKNKNIIPMGFSNGANMLLYFIRKYPNVLDNLVLMSPVNLLPEIKYSSLNNKNILLVSATNDEYESFESILLLEDNLKSAGAKVNKYYHHFGHVFNKTIVNNIKDWYEDNF